MTVKLRNVSRVLITLANTFECFTLQQLSQVKTSVYGANPVQTVSLFNLAMRKLWYCQSLVLILSFLLLSASGDVPERLGL